MTTTVQSLLVKLFVVGLAWRFLCFISWKLAALPQTSALFTVTGLGLCLLPSPTTFKPYIPALHDLLVTHLPYLQQGCKRDGRLAQPSTIPGSQC